ncbi:MAG: hypothetical protein JW810_14655, partial [Sedimentisphaerales bacterium]|nr:hypothetical protein [Sedimentisphaerales bacterium]
SHFMSPTANNSTAMNIYRRRRDPGSTQKHNLLSKKHLCNPKVTAHLCLRIGTASGMPLSGGNIDLSYLGLQPVHTLS